MDCEVLVDLGLVVVIDIRVLINILLVELLNYYGRFTLLALLF